MDEPNFADRMKRMRETAHLLQKTETAENTVSYRPPEFRRPVWYISMYAMMGGGGGPLMDWACGLATSLGRWVKSC